MASKRKSLRLSAFFFFAILVGCGGSRQSDPMNQNNLSGNWTGMLSSSNPSHSRAIDLFVTQNGNSLAGPRAQLGFSPGPLCDSNGTMSGAASGNQVTMNVVVPPNPTRANLNQSLTLTGTVQAAVISGTYSETSGCLNGDSGTFQMSPVPSITSSQSPGTVSPGDLQWSGTWSDSYSELEYR
jgi:hypothetical protein